VGLFYRLNQFWRMWQARPLPDEAHEMITAVLTPPEITLFTQFSLNDQHHSYQVLRTLQSNGQTHPDLLAAALLHDVGKTRAPLSIWQRSLIVLAQTFLPGKTAVWGQGSVDGWQRPFVVKSQHPAWGAEMAQAAGSRLLTIELIRRHQELLPETLALTEADHLLRLLQWADNQN
jgi:hypothetical protein